MITIGVDPGAAGALTLRIAGVVKDIKDMPYIEEKVGKTMRKRVNSALLANLLRDWLAIGCGRSVQMYCEKVGPTPHDGVASAFAFGRAAGVVEGAAAGLSIPFTRVPTADWHRAMSCSKDKNANRARACQLYPAWASMFSRVKDDGRAESALIAEYGERSFQELMR